MVKTVSGSNVDAWHFLRFAACPISQLSKGRIAQSSCGKIAWQRRASHGCPPENPTQVQVGLLKKFRLTGTEARNVPRCPSRNNARLWSHIPWTKQRSLSSQGCALQARRVLQCSTALLTAPSGLDSRVTWDAIS